jgi:hypothetical protein
MAGSPITAASFAFAEDDLMLKVTNTTRDGVVGIQSSGRRAGHQGSSGSAATSLRGASPRQPFGSVRNVPR